MAQRLACPFLKFAAKDGPLSATALGALASKCPHMAATGVQPAAVIAQLAMPSALAELAKPSAAQSPCSTCHCTGEFALHTFPVPACPAFIRQGSLPGLATSKLTRWHTAVSDCANASRGKHTPTPLGQAVAGESMFPGLRTCSGRAAACWAASVTSVSSRGGPRVCYTEQLRLYCLCVPV